MGSHGGGGGYHGGSRCPGSQYGGMPINRHKSFKQINKYIALYRFCPV